MRHWCCVVLAACAAAAPPPATSSSPTPGTDRIALVERGLAPPVQIRGEEQRFAIEDRMREHKVPAVSIAVFDNYELQWAKAYGVVEAGAPKAIDTETTFLAGSISKSVNALGVLLAAADGTFGPNALDAPINTLLASWKLPDNELTQKTPVTLRKLLSHTAGTTVHGFPGYAAGKPIPTVTQILDGAPPANTAAIRVDLAPGTKFRYSGGGTTISQLALADRSKQPYPAILATRVLGPLGMTSSSYEQELSPERLAHAAVGHGRNGTAITGKRHRYPEMAAAGLWTTPTDLARFFVAIARAHAGKESKVPRAVAVEMTTRVADVDANEGVGVALGVFLFDRNGTAWFGHDGSDAGFQAQALASLDGGRGLVIMTSSDNGFRIFPEIERAVFEAYGWPGRDAPVERVALDAAQRAKFAGSYVQGPTALVIADDGGKLVARPPFEPPVELVPIAPDQLVERATGRRVKLTATGLELAARRGPARAVTRLAGRHHMIELEAGRFDDAVAAWRERAKADPKAAIADEDFANNLGYQLLERDRGKAVELLRLIATVFPDSSNAHDSLGEAYMMIGDKPRAIAEYELAVKLLDADPRVTPEQRVVRRKHGEEQLAKLRAP